MWYRYLFIFKQNIASVKREIANSIRYDTNEKVRNQPISNLVACFLEFSFSLKQIIIMIAKLMFLGFIYNCSILQNATRRFYSFSWDDYINCIIKIHILYAYICSFVSQILKVLWVTFVLLSFLCYCFFVNLNCSTSPTANVLLFLIF